MKLIELKSRYQTPFSIFWVALMLLLLIAHSQKIEKKNVVFNKQVNILKNTSDKMIQAEIHQRIQKLSSKKSILKNLRPIADENTELSEKQLNSKSFYKVGIQQSRIQSKRTNIASTSGQALQKTFQHRLLTGGAPSSFDWSTKLQLTSVKSIGYCAASWTFAATAFFEADSIINLNSSSNLDLSEQYLISCDPISSGCRSGFLQGPIDLVVNKGGIPLQSDYPYSPIDSQQKNNCKPKSVFQVTNSYRMSYYDLYDQQKIKSIVLKKPAVIAMCGQDLINYFPGQTQQSKILKCHPSNRILDHTALLVGYTQKYWIIKNEWGTNWGINGYAYISRNQIQDCCIGQQIHTTGAKTTNCSIEYCNTCIEQHTCFKCQPSRYVYHQPFTGVQSCKQCLITNCAECFDYYGYCSYCIDGYAINDATGNCQPSNIDGCNHIVNGYCVQCHKGFMLATNMATCSPDCTVKNCYNCANGPCTQCKPGYSLQQVNNSQVCNKNPCNVTNCSACDPNGICVACNKYLTLQSTSCINKCTIPDCLFCSPQDWFCSQCTTGKSFNYWTQICETFNISYCSIHLFGKCYSCITGYEFDKAHTACLQICDVNNCISCDTSDITICLTCKVGYSLNIIAGETVCTAYTCNITNCSACDINGTTCLSCITQFHVYNATAKACQIQCSLTNCQICLPTSTICDKCKSGYAIEYSSSQCYAMNFSHCSLVGFDTGKLQCWECENKYKVDYINWDKCTLNCYDFFCAVCDYNTLAICSKCIDGYSLYLSNSRLQCQKIPSLIPKCQLVSLNQTHCYQCDDYYQFDSQFIICKPYNLSCTDPNCLYCPIPGSTATGCQCIPGFVYDNLANQCVINPFDDNCLKVVLYISQLICIQCNDGFILSNDYTSCVEACISSNCAQCYDYYNDYCRICIDGFYSNETWICVNCPVTNCKTCTSTTCLQCMVGYYLVPDGSACLPYICTNEFVFNGFSCSCPLGTYFTNNTCFNCNDNCDKCDIDGCIECKIGFYMLNNSCISCIPNCDICNNTTACIMCKNKFFFEDTTGKCIQIGFNRTYFIYGQQIIQCPAGCIECTQNMTCKLCSEGYSLSSVNNQCLPCEGNCKTCSFHIPSACLSCNPGYYYDGLKCLPCANSFCIECNTATYVCTKCAVGYSLKEKSCVKCPQDCLQCNYKNQCTRCIPGFTITDKKTCEQCFGGCLSCNPTYLNQCVNICSNSQYMQNGICKKCDSKCSKCLNSTVCQVCKTGYILNGDSCINPCQQGCYKCDNTNYQQCIQCYTGYYLSPENNCIPNTTCTNNSCITCPNQYILQLGSCVSCATNSNCSQCSQLDNSRCIQCIDTFYLSNKTCYKCPNQCKKCTREKVCMECSDGYFLMGIENDYTGRCIACSAQCKACAISPNNCLSCIDDTYELTVSNKCLKKDKILIITKLDISYDLYATIARNIREDFASLLGSNYVNQTMYVILKSIKSGSTILQVLLSVPENEDPTSILDRVKKQLTSSNTLGGVSIIQVSQVVIYDPNGNYDQNQHQQQLSTSDNSQKKNVLTIVLAVVIPSIVVIALIIIGCIIKNRKNNNSNSIVNQNSFSADGAPSQSSKKTNAKNVPVGLDHDNKSNESEAYIFQNTFQTNDNLVNSQKKMLSQNANQAIAQIINQTQQDLKQAINIEQTEDKKQIRVEFQQIKIQKRIISSSDQEEQKREDSESNVQRRQDQFQIKSIQHVDDRNSDMLASHFTKVKDNKLLANQDILEIDEDD